MKLIYEIGCEELPAAAVDVALHFLPQQLEKELGAARLSFSHLLVHATPRRLVVEISDLSPTQSDLTLEILGPRVEQTFQATGELSPAVLGFLKAKNLDSAQTYSKQTDRGWVLAAQWAEKGKPAISVLPELLLRVTLQIPFAKTMRWESSRTRFARPIRWLLCLLDDQVVPFEIAGVHTSNRTCGHRFLAPSFQEVTTDTYSQHLEQSGIVLSKEEREARIWEQAQALAKSIGGRVKPDPELLSIVANLVESPWPVLGQFEQKYLDIPQEILISEMREHQKYFAVLDANEKLLPFFVLVSACQPSHPTRLAAGNARVLKARFEDGGFYYFEDQKKALSDFLPTPSLELMNCSRRLGELLAYPDPIELERATQLCKADLQTGVVGEFPELQGVMGSIYAAQQGESPAVCQGIREHYWPKFSGDALPQTQLGAILSVADRLHTLTSRKIPKGSADPYGLRRAAIGLTRLIVFNRFELDLQSLLPPDVLEFVMNRARSVFLENHSTLIVDATQSASKFNLLAWSDRIDALKQFNFAAVAAVFKRVSNLVSKSDDARHEASLESLESEADFALRDAILSVSLDSNFRTLLEELEAIKPILDRFFEETLVMCEDRALRNARLKLLMEVQTRASFVADFSRLSASS
ncbi:MAG: glycine--tRNA ligase subunit beta [Myxococcaceae bacterium]|nr:glycine--tRNA ligase subunit beta [Myxococcaceae bacterium]MBH2006618.1 glycine--tRNA ligase subunit beta [Myxococcaceae bacterium]